MEIFYNIEQGSDSWYAIRAGIPTASEFSTVMAKGRGGGESKTRRTYLLRLAGERLTGEPMERYSNHHMERGHVQEPEARSLYCLMNDVDPVQVGFIRNGDKGCSPDSLIDEPGMLECKSAMPHIQLDRLLKDELPPEHKAQCQGGLWVAEREWIDFVSYCPRLPLFVKRVYRDEEYIKTLAAEVERFNAELSAIVERFQEAA